MARKVATILSLEGVQQVVAGFKQAGNAAQEYATKASSTFDKATSYVNKHSATITQLGGIATKAGLIAAAGLAAVTKAAMDWESSWAGVLKTVDGTPAQLAALETELRSLAKSMPATHEEIAAVAEAAGQLGIQRENVAAFTKTMIQLGETTNLSADVAATSLAKFMNIMGTSQSQVGRLGAALVALGNDGASTEADIMSMSMRIAAAGKQVGMSEADVMGFANALASVGVEAEMGGTAISMSFKQIDAAVRQGGASLDLIAKTSGKTSAEFVKAWKTDAASATADFVGGLGKMQSKGEDVNKVLDDLGMTGIRQSDSLLRLASATAEAGNSQDLLRESLKLGAEAYAENTALTDEYAKRAETAASQAKVAWNNIKDAAIETGQSMLPVVADIAQVVADLASAFGDLPDGVQDFALGSAAVIAAGGLMFGALTKVVTTVSSLKSGLVEMGVEGRTASLSMGAIGVALTIASVALGAWIGQQAEATALANEYADAIRAQGSAIGEQSNQLANAKLEQDGALKSADTLGLKYADLTAAVQGNADAYGRIADRITEVQRAWDNGKATKEEYQATQNLNKVLGKQREAYGEGAESAARKAEADKQAADSAESASDGVDTLTGSIKENTAATQEALQAAQQWGNILLALSGSNIAVEAAIDSLTGSIEKNGQTLDINTEQGRNNQQALDNLASAGMRQIQTLVESKASTEELTAKQQYLTDQWVAGAVQAGMLEGDARALAAAYFALPETESTDVSAPGVEYTQEQIDALRKKIEDVPAEKRSTILSAWKRGDYDAVVAGLAALQDKTVTITTNYVVNGYPTISTGARDFKEAKDGAIVDYLAAGGIRGYWSGYTRPKRREHHIAEIAPAGSWRVFGEPETGGEAYIPLASAKRGRSTAILDQVADRFGYRLVRMASGGLLSDRLHPSPSTVSNHYAGSPSLTVAPVFQTPVDPQIQMRHLIDDTIASARRWRQ